MGQLDRGSVELESLEGLIGTLADVCRLWSAPHSLRSAFFASSLQPVTCVRFSDNTKFNFGCAHLETVKRLAVHLTAFGAVSP